MIAKRRDHRIPPWPGRVFPQKGVSNERAPGKNVRHAYRKKERRISDAPIYWFFVIAALAYLLGTWLWSFVPPATWQR